MTGTRVQTLERRCGKCGHAEVSHIFTPKCRTWCSVWDPDPCGCKAFVAPKDGTDV